LRGGAFRDLRFSTGVLGDDKGDKVLRPSEGVTVAEEDTDARFDDKSALRRSTDLIPPLLPVAEAKVSKVKLYEILNSVPGLAGASKSPL
jgi:hypothetical protein